MALVRSILSLLSITYALDNDQAIKAAESVRDLFPVITELVSLEELQTILLSKHETTTNAPAKVAQKEGELIPTIAQQRLNLLREERELNKTYLDNFLSQHGLSHIFDNDIFWSYNFCYILHRYAYLLTPEMRGWDVRL